MNDSFLFVLEGTIDKDLREGKIKSPTADKTLGRHNLLTQ